MELAENFAVLDTIEKAGEIRFFSNPTVPFQVLEILRASSPHAFVPSLMEVTDKSDSEYVKNLRKHVHGPGVVVRMEGCRFVLQGSLSLFKEIDGFIISFHNKVFTATYVNELLARGWDTNEIFSQQLATFFPFPETLLGRYEVAGFMMRLLDNKTDIRTFFARLPEAEQANRIFEVVQEVCKEET